MSRPLKSETLSDFLSLIEECQQKRPWAEECLKNEDLLTQDYLHKLELGTYKGRTKIATAISINRKNRRYSKVLKEAQICNDRPED
ncbi:hypothetical protein NIA71_06855 [Ihubacter massiliensis]|uniref:Uncharacterized protein n=1 Tax=Hominibacterium faecale TaxID=2839743 RepID=A0A9J6QNB4_9FIRM|nr:MULTISPECIES: hypothetical protein [Eubacteriales Family XIII. Incertae Sedis]MCO7121668.1 hypothetical protein [Ihubacter massiliensis]MCU7378649.1 hypothetical protein [Hominibacterium faecale]